jgi:hypothetical protein
MKLSTVRDRNEIRNQRRLGTNCFRTYPTFFNWFASAIERAVRQTVRISDFTIVAQILPKALCINFLVCDPSLLSLTRTNEKCARSPQFPPHPLPELFLSCVTSMISEWHSCLSVFLRISNAVNFMKPNGLRN